MAEQGKKLINPPGLSELAEQVATLAPVKPGDLGDPLDVSDQVRFRLGEELVCHLTRRPGENATVRPVEQVPERGRRSVVVKHIAETPCQTRDPATRIPSANP